MFDVSYQTMLELVGSMREFVKENPVESNLREMGRACIETYVIRPLEDRDDHSLYLEAIYWYQRLLLEHLEAKGRPDGDLEAKEQPDGDQEAKERPDGD